MGDTVLQTNNCPDFKTKVVHNLVGVALPLYTTEVIVCDVGYIACVLAYDQGFLWLQLLHTKSTVSTDPVAMTYIHTITIQTISNVHRISVSN